MIWQTLDRGVTVPGGVVTEQDHESGGVMTVYGSGVPDVVRLPAPLGGHEVRVTQAVIGPCACGGHDAQHLTLDGAVSCCWCCERNEYLWYETRGAA